MFSFYTIFVLVVIASIFAWALWGFFAPTLEPFLSSQVQIPFVKHPCMKFESLMYVDIFYVVIQFRLNEKQIGLVFLTLPVASTVCAPVVGKLVDKFVSMIIINTVTFLYDNNSFI